jgi:hypothetical protein
MVKHPSASDGYPSICRYLQGRQTVAGRSCTWHYGKRGSHLAKKHHSSLPLAVRCANEMHSSTFCPNRGMFSSQQHAIFGYIRKRHCRVCANQYLNWAKQGGGNHLKDAGRQEASRPSLFSYCSAVPCRSWYLRFVHLTCVLRLSIICIELAI